MGNMVDKNIKWENNFNLVSDYYMKNGKLPIQTDKENGGGWLQVQRRYLKTGKLSDERKRILDSLCINWHDVRSACELDNNWNIMLLKVKSYFDKNGKLPSSTDCDNGGRWISYQRRLFFADKLRTDRIDILNKELPNWNIEVDTRYDDDAWFKYLNIVKEYYLEMECFPVCSDVINGGCWLQNQAKFLRLGKLRSDRLEILNKELPGWNSVRKGPTNDVKWKVNFNTVVRFYELNGKLPNTFDKENGGHWLKRQRQDYKLGYLREDRKDILDKKLPQWVGLNGLFTQDEIWLNNLEKVKRYYDMYKDYPNISDRVNCGAWLITQRKMYKNGSLSDDRIQKLNDTLPNWNNEVDEFEDMLNWLSCFSKVKKYCAVNKKFPLKKDIENCGAWLFYQRELLKCGKLLDDRKEMLDNELPDWISEQHLLSNDELWFSNLIKVKNYYERYGYYPSANDRENGGAWLSHQRYKKSNGTLKIERLELLDTNLPYWYLFKKKVMSIAGKSCYKVSKADHKKLIRK